MSDKTKEELHNQLQIAEQKAEALAAMLATLGHEVKTPIGIAVTAASNLELKAQNMQQDYRAGKMTQQSLESFLSLVCESAEILQANTRRASTLMDSLKQLALDQAHERVRAIHLANYFQQLAASISPALKQSQCDLSINCDDALVLNNCPGALTQILTNLLMNAIQHAQVPNQKLLLELSANDLPPSDSSSLAVQICLNDNGAGMSSEVKAQAFDQFFTTAQDNGGSGLGLNIVSHLVKDSLLGTIECHSRLGEGSRFILSLPNLPLSDN